MTRRVLVADDHSLFRDGLVSLLEAAGYEIAAQVADGQQALIQAKRTRPDLILLDLSMPRLNGLEALPQLLEIVPDAKIVILTVSEEDDDLLKVIQAGAHGYLVKNLNAEDFLALLGGLERANANCLNLWARVSRTELSPKSFPSAPTQLNIILKTSSRSSGLKTAPKPWLMPLELEFSPPQKKRILPPKLILHLTTMRSNF